MRKEFCDWLTQYGSSERSMVFFTGDLGFNALEGVKNSMNERFVNAGVSEQNMISVAAACAQQGLRTMCYSIAPFIVFRPAEHVRLNIGIHNLDVKVVGNGGGYGYGIMGSTHHALEDIAVLSSFPNMVCYIPVANQQVPFICDAMMKRKGPAYLRLGFGSLSRNTPAYSPVLQLEEGHSMTIIGMGPALLNVLPSISSLPQGADVFAVQELPLSPEHLKPLLDSLRRTQKLVVIEEHVARGGLYEYIAGQILKALHPGDIKTRHAHAHGYPDGRYGSQNFHQKKSGLDADSLSRLLQELIHE